MDVLRDFRDVGDYFRGKGFERAWIAWYLEEDSEVREAETTRWLLGDVVTRESRENVKAATLTSRPRHVIAFISQSGRLHSTE